MATWKRVERAIARLVGGERVPVSGRAGEPDVRHTEFSIEVKHRKTVPKWLTGGLQQSERAADGRIPLLVVHPAGERYERSLVVLRLEVFLALWTERCSTLRERE